MSVNIRKTTCVLLVAALTAGAVGGCGLFDGKAKEEMTESLTAYLEAVRGGDYSEGRQYVEGRDDYFHDNELEPMQAKIVETVFAETEFEIGEITIDRPSATAEVTVIMPDIYSLQDMGYSFDEYMDAVSGIDGTMEETLEFEFVKGEDGWLIEPLSTEDFFAFCESIGEGIDFGPLNEYTAAAAVDALIGLLAEGNIEGALAMTPYADLGSALTDFDGLDNILSVYFTSLIYELDVVEMTDEQITMHISGSAPNVEAMMTIALENRDELIEAISQSITAGLGADPSEAEYVSYFVEPIIDSIDPAAISTLDGTFIVTADENGNLIVDPQADLNPIEFSFPGL